jgi:hypothetical protein
MPVELPSAQWDTTPPAPPRLVVWLGILIVIVLASVTWTLLTWPKGVPTQTAWFWARLFAFPALAWCFLYGLRWLYHEQEAVRLQAEDEALAAERAAALLFAREPLAMLAVDYLCALGSSGVAARIADGERKLESRLTLSGDASVRHTALEIPGLTQEDRFQSCFEALLRRLNTVLTQIPRRVPLTVYLALPPEAMQDKVLQLWQRCWEAAGCHASDTVALSLGQGVMALDDWLDIRGGPALEKFALFVAVQLHDVPSDNSAEAAVALLLGWAPLAEKMGLNASALLHRPVCDGVISVSETMSRAILWGNTEANNIGDLWVAGLEKDDHHALMQAASDVSVGLTTSEQAGAIHDMDTALGHAGVAAAWLALALAAERASHQRKPQLAASRQCTLRMAVLLPASATEDAGQQG